MRYLHLTLTGLISCAVALALSGCGSTVMNNSMAGHTPTVSGIGAEANGVAPNRWMYVQFNEAMDPSTINNQTMTVTDSSGRSVPGNVAYYSNFDVAGFQPNPALQTNTTYTLTVTTGAKSAQGVALQSNFTHNFTTRAETDKSPISVKTVMPTNGATCVSASTLITITFTEGADVSTLTSSNIVLTGPGNTMIPAKISYNVATAQATISPNAALPSGTISVTVSNVADSAGVAMSTPYMWSFSTACSTGGGGGTATTQYMTPIYGFNPYDGRAHGTVSVDTAGMISIHMVDVPATTTYDVQFCEAVSPFAPNQPTSCMEITKITTDSSSNGDARVKFPQPGNWAGDFAFNDSSAKTDYATDLPTTETNDTYTAVLLPVTDTNGGAATNYNGSPQQPLSSGAVTSSGGNVTFTIKGGTPNLLYDGNDSETNYIDSSGTYEMCTFTSDAQGNGSCSAPMTASSGGDIFQVAPQSGGNGYIGGFSVPQ